MLRTLVAQYLREHVQSQLAEATRQSLAQPPHEGAPSAPPPPCDVAIVFALGIEAGGTVDLLEHGVTTRFATLVDHVGSLGGRQVALLEAGFSQQAAAAATAEAVALHQVKWVISAGFAAGLCAPMKRGHFLIADEVVDVHGHHVKVDLHVQPASLVNNRSLHVGRLLTVDHLLRSAEERYRLGNNHAALACDMETLGVAQACQQHQVRFLAVRIISEAVEDELPKDLERLFDQRSLAAKLGAAAAAIWNRPSTIKEMWQLREEAIKTSDRLAKFLAGVVANLPLASEEAGRDPV